VSLGTRVHATSWAECVVVVVVFVDMSESVISVRRAARAQRYDSGAGQRIPLFVGVCARPVARVPVKSLFQWPLSRRVYLNRADDDENNVLELTGVQRALASAHLDWKRKRAGERSNKLAAQVQTINKPNEHISHTCAAHSLTHTASSGAA
jgi:hypothetical protein